MERIFEVLAALVLIIATGVVCMWFFVSFLLIRYTIWKIRKGEM